MCKTEGSSHCQFQVSFSHFISQCEACLARYCNTQQMFSATESVHRHVAADEEAVRQQDRTQRCPKFQVPLLYREGHLLLDLSWVDLDFGSSTFCLVLLGLVGSWQNWLCDWARWWNMPNLSQLNPVRMEMDHLPVL